MLVTVIGGTIAALVVFALDLGNKDTTPIPRATTSKAGPSCEPAINFKGFNDSLPPGSKVSQGAPPAGTYDGQIAGGDLLRVQGPGQKSFGDSATVRPGEVVSVGLMLDNPGPGEVGEVKVHVQLPKQASNALELRVIVSFLGVAGASRVTDTASILVQPSQARACARYILGSTRKRIGNGKPEQENLDWIASRSGAYYGSIGNRPEDVKVVYFDVVVV